MTIKLSMPISETQLKPRITVIGVGGAGGNAVNNMISSNLEGADFLVCNTDSQALEQSVAEHKIQLGVTLTQGLGAGARPEVGKGAAEEVLEDILDQIQGSNMVFVTAGMGGGTGTGAAPVIARAARENGMLTVGVVTKPFHFEGAQRMRIAEEGIEELSQFVDTLIIIPNQNLFRIANEKTTFAEAFNMADEVLNSGVRGVTDLMVMPGLINLDFADIRTVMSEMGKAMMGTGESDGENRAIEAAEAAISNPLLDDITMEGARGVLINITGGPDITLFEVDEAANRIRQEVDENANILFGSTFDESMAGKVRVSVVATGIDSNGATRPIFKPRVVADAVAKPVPSLNAPSLNQEKTVTPEVALDPTPIEQAVEAAKSATNERSEPDLPDAVPAFSSPPSTPTSEPIGTLDTLEDGIDEERNKDAVEEEMPVLDSPDEVGLSTGAGMDIPVRAPFIPPQPVEIGEALDTDRHADAYNEAAYSNARNDFDFPRKKKRPSLFKRLTNAVTREDENVEMATTEPSPPVFEKPASVAAPPQAPTTPEPIGQIAEIPAITPSLPSNSKIPNRHDPAPLDNLHREDVTTPEIATQTPSPAPKAPQPPVATVPITATTAPDEFSLSQADEEMLEIPSFLRRQAN
jgi:cell division protein FtsZ